MSSFSKLFYFWLEEICYILCMIYCIDKNFPGHSHHGQKIACALLLPAGMSMGRFTTRFRKTCSQNKMIASLEAMHDVLHRAVTDALDKSGALDESISCCEGSDDKNGDNRHGSMSESQTSVFPFRVMVKSFSRS